MTDPPRRRMTDKERRRWPDERLDDLKEDLEDVEHQLQALRMLPDRVKGIREGVDSVREAEHTNGQRITDLRADLRTLAQSVGRISQRLQALHEKIDEHIEEERVTLDGLEKLGRGIDPKNGEPLPVAPTFRPDIWFWLKLMGACATAGGVPIAVAIITSSP